MEQIEIFRNDRAKYYDEFVKIWIVNYEFVLNALPKIITQYNPDLNNILVVGCGTGKEIEKLIEYNPDYLITGVDPSEEMITLAEEKFRNNNNIKLCLGTTEALDNTSIYEAASLFLVLHFMKDDGSKQNLLQNIYDKLAPNAPLVILDIFGDKDTFAFNLEFLKQLLPNEWNGMNISERITTLPNRITPISEERLGHLLKQAGFTAPIRFFQSAIYGAWVCQKL